MPNKKVFVVVTIVNDGERDLFGDIVLITENKTEAEKLVKRLKNREIELDWLGEYEGADFFSRTLNKLST